MSTQTIKKLTALLLSMILSASIFLMPGLFAGAENSEEMNWSFDSETGKLTLSGNGPMEKFKEIGNGAVPWYEYSDSIKELYINEGITTICQPAFAESESLKKVTIPSSVKYIADNAFLYCEALESITIPDGVVEIGEDAFFGCFALKSVSIGKDLTEIGHYAFYNCLSLESFTVSPENTAFSSDEYGVLFNKDKTELIQYPIGNSRDTYNIPDGVETIAAESFMDALALANISLPDSVTYIGGNPFGGTAFFDTPANWTDGILYMNDKYLISAGHWEEISGTYEVKEGTKVIAGGAFSSCDLTSITIPASVVSVGETAFSCENLSKITVDEKSEYLTSVDNVLFTKDMSELVYYPMAKAETSYEIPSGVEKIADYAFMNSYFLENVVIPEGVTEIGEYAFAVGQSLKNVSFPDSLISVGYNAFYYCGLLDSVSFGSGLKYIDDNAFSYCSNLSSVEFSEGIIEIGNFAFYSCSVEELFIPDSIEKIGKQAFAFCYSLKKLTVGISADSENDLHSVASTKAIIESEAFVECPQLVSAVINAADIGIGAFSNCNALETLTLFEGLERLRYRAFFGCAVKDLYYYGTEESWLGTEISSGNTEYILNGNFHIMYKEIETSGIMIRYTADCFDEEVIFSVEDLNGISDEIGGGIYDMAGYKRIGLYSIKPLNKDGNVVQPKNGKVEIRLPVTETVDEEAVHIICHIFSDSVREMFTTNPKAATDKLLRIVDGYYVIEVDHFSEFAIYEELNEAGFEPDKKTVASISVATLPAKTSYTYKNGSLDLSGLALTVTYSDETTETVTYTSKMKASGFDISKVGTQTVTVEYEGATASFDVTVSYTLWQWIIRILLLGFLWY